MLKENRWKSAGFLFQFVLIYYWMIFLLDADSHYAVYLLTGTAGILCCGINWKVRIFPEEKREKILTLLFSFVLSTAVVAANYAMFTDPESSKWNKVFSLIVICMGGMIAFGQILVCLAARLQSFSFIKKKEQNRKLLLYVVFLSAAAPMAILNLLLLFLSEYPGNFTVDSMNQIGQILTGNYSNHHPFYHTMIIGFFVKIGYAVWGNMNAAVAVYNVFQILFLSACFSFGMVTLYQTGVPVKYIVVCDLFYTLMPFHLVYSITVWKDVLFGGFVLLFTVAVFRVLGNIGSHKIINYLIFLFGSLGTCLLRSNGWLAYLLVFGGFLLLFKWSDKKLCISFFFVLVVSFILKHPVLAALNVSQPDTIESLSIPTQQIARVITEYNDLTEEQKTLLNEIVSVDDIPIEYVNYISDPIKSMIRRRNYQPYLDEHKGEFLKLYVELGIKHPKGYVKAWIDQTRGFWNGGYRYWVWSQGVQANDFGISREVKSAGMHLWLYQYVESFSDSNVLVIFLSIGFYVWIVSMVCYISLIRKDKIACFLTFPVLAVILTLLVATPVFAEFRYAYAVFCTVPFLLFVPFTDRSEMVKTNL